MLRVLLSEAKARWTGLCVGGWSWETSERPAESTSKRLRWSCSVGWAAWEWRATSKTSMTPAKASIRVVSCFRIIHSLVSGEILTQKGFLNFQLFSHFVIKLNLPNCGAPKAAAIKAKSTIKNFILKYFLELNKGKCDLFNFQSEWFRRRKILRIYSSADSGEATRNWLAERW